MNRTSVRVIEVGWPRRNERFLSMTSKITTRTSKVTMTLSHVGIGLVMRRTGKDHWTVTQYMLNAAPNHRNDLDTKGAKECLKVHRALGWMVSVETDIDAHYFDAPAI